MIAGKHNFGIISVEECITQYINIISFCFVMNRWSIQKTASVNVDFNFELNRVFGYSFVKPEKKNWLSFWKHFVVWYQYLISKRKEGGEIPVLVIRCDGQLRQIDAHSLQGKHCIYCFLQRRKTFPDCINTCRNMK